MNDTPWLKFDAEKWLSGEIQEATPESRSLYIDMIALSWSRDIVLLRSLKRRDCYSDDALEELIELGMCQIVSGKLKIAWIERMKDATQEMVERNRVRAKHAADARWGNKQCLDDAKSIPQAMHQAQDGEENENRLRVIRDGEGDESETGTDASSPPPSFSHELGKIQRVCRVNHDDSGWRHLFDWCHSLNPKLFDMAMTKAVQAQHPNKPYLSEVDEWARRINQANQGETE